MRMIDQQASRGDARSQKARNASGLAIWAMILLSNPSPVTGILTPAVSADIIQRFHFSFAEASRLIALELGGMTLGLIFSALLVARADRRRFATLAILVALTGQIATFSSSHFVIISTARFIAGCGAGAAYAVAVASMAGTRNADRTFGLSMASNQLTGAVILAVLAFAGPSAEGYGAIIAFISLLVIAGCGVPWLPRAAPVRASDQTAPSSRGDKPTNHHPAFLGVAAMFLLASGLGAVWPAIGQIGAERGVAAVATAHALAWGAMAGILAGLLAAWLGLKVGRLTPLIIGASGLTGAILCLATPHVFIIGTVGIMFFWVFANSYYFGAVSNIDPMGRLATATGAMVPAGMAAGQISASAVGIGAYRPLTILACLSCLVSLGAIVVAVTMHRRMSEVIRPA